MKRSELKERLQTEGKWDAFVAQRDEFKKAGMSPSEARDKALALVDAATGASQGIVIVAPHAAAGPVQPVDPAGDRWITKAQFADKESVSPREECQWVYNNMWVRDVRPEDAPSPGAWGYLMECRGNITIKQNFYNGTWSKLLPTKSELDKNDLFNDDGRDTINLIERVQKASANALLQPGA